MKITFLFMLVLCTATLAQDSDQPERPYLVTVETVVFRVPVGDLKSLGIQAEKTAHPLALFRTLLLRVEAEKARIVSQARLTSRSGVKATAGSAEELIYPRAYLPLKENGDGRGYPEENRMTKMGLVFTATAQAFSKDELQVDLDFACDIAKPELVDYQKALTTLKAGAPVTKVDELGFRRHRIRDTVTVASGGVALLAVRSLPKSLDAESAYRDLILLRAAVHH